MTLLRIIKKWQKEVDRLNSEVISNKEFLQIMRENIKLMNDKLQELLNELKQLS